MKKHRKENEENQEMAQEDLERNKTDQTGNKPTAPGEEVSQAEQQPPAETPEASAEQKVNELQDKYLRLSAEFDNYRKRTMRERVELIKSAGEDVLTGILPVLDNFERALSHLAETQDFGAIKDGIVLIYSKFKDFLSQRGIREIESLNVPFNADLHDAIARMPVQEKEKHNLVIEVLEKGYYLNDKIVRHAKVLVGDYYETVPQATQNLD